MRMLAYHLCILIYTQHTQWVHYIWHNVAVVSVQVLPVSESLVPYGGCDNIQNLITITIRPDVKFEEISSIEQHAAKRSRFEVQRDEFNAYMQTLQRREPCVIIESVDPLALTFHTGTGCKCQTA